MKHSLLLFCQRRKHHQPSSRCLDLQPPVGGRLNSCGSSQDAAPAVKFTLGKVAAVAQGFKDASPFLSHWNQASDDAKQPKVPWSQIFDTELVPLRDRQARIRGAWARPKSDQLHRSDSWDLYFDTTAVWTNPNPKMTSFCSVDISTLARQDKRPPSIQTSLL